MKIKKQTIKRPGQFPYDQFISYSRGRSIDFKVCLFGDLKGAYFKRNNFGDLALVRQDGNLNDWIDDIENKIKDLQKQREFLVKVREIK